MRAKIVTQLLEEFRENGSFDKSEITVHEIKQFYDDNVFNKKHAKAIKKATNAMLNLTNIPDSSHISGANMFIAQHIESNSLGLLFSFKNKTLVENYFVTVEQIVSCSVEMYKLDIVQTISIHNWQSVERMTALVVPTKSLSTLYDDNNRRPLLVQVSFIIGIMFPIVEWLDIKNITEEV
jgi:hypothetical protein